MTHPPGRRKLFDHHFARLGAALGGPYASYTGGSEEPAAPVPSTVPPDSEQVVLTEEDEIAELGAVPTADPDRVAEDEAADEGDLQPRQFLGAGGDGLGGAEEPVHLNIG